MPVSFRARIGQHSPPADTEMHARLLVTWLVVSLAGAMAVSSPAPAELPWLLAATMLFGALTAATTRSALLLGGARKGAATVDQSAPPHRLWRGGVLALVVGALLGAAVGGAASLLERPTSWLGWGALFVGTTALAFPAGVVLGQRALRRPRSPRSSTTLAWILLDTALPAGALAALAGALVVGLRYGSEPTVSGVEVSRHLALSLLLYGALLGVAGGLKTAREKLAKLVDAPAPSLEPPGAIATGATLGLVVLVVGPRVLGEVPTEVLVFSKAALGLMAGTGLCALGALRGARR